MKRVIVAGDRKFQDYDFVKRTLDKLLSYYLPNVVIISGCCSGADLLGEAWAAENDLQVDRFPADWSKGRRAGPERNVRMIAANADALIVFNGGGPGSRNILSRAKKADLAVAEIPIGDLLLEAKWRGEP